MCPKDVIVVVSAVTVIENVDLNVVILPFCAVTPCCYKLRWCNTHIF